MLRTLLLVCCLSTVITAQEPARWLRYAAISPDGQTVVFTYKGDLYTVPTTGGRATQLTFHPAHDYLAT